MSKEHVDGGTIRAALVCARPSCACHRAPRRATGLVHCAAHADEHPSLSVTEASGRVLFHCQAGCAQDGPSV